VAFEDLTPQSKEYITALAANVDGGTHTPNIVRYSGNIEDPRSRIVQKSAGTEPDYMIVLEGFGAGESFQRLVVKNLLKGGWVSPDTWEGVVDDSAMAAYRAG
jgi:hypothetical protein